MFFDAISYREYLLQKSKKGSGEAILSFLSFLERKLGGVMMYPLAGVPEGRLDLIEPFRIGTLLRERGIIQSFQRVAHLPDEPPFCLWETTINGTANSLSGGMALQDPGALSAALGEGLERYLWKNEWDYFRSPRCTSQSALKSSMASFLPIQDLLSPGKTMLDDAEFIWVLGDSLTTGKHTFVPAQTANGAMFPGIQTEPILLKERTSAGLATWPTESGARLAGILELIEHDAFMIMWLNQLSLPRVVLDSFRTSKGTLAALLARCARYRLKVHAVSMATDAPTHAICVVVEDTAGHTPRFTIGLKAHRTLSIAIEKALLEALRARIFYRSSETANTFDDTRKTDSIRHEERLSYWALAKNTAHLAFLIEGEEREPSTMEWEHDSESHHLQRFVRWLQQSNIECIAISVGTSRTNPLPWHVVKIIIPALQPLYLNEENRSVNENRARVVALQCNLTLRPHAYVDKPHPFY